MANKDKYYFRNVSRRWKAEASRARKIQFFSPYITSSTAETVMHLDTGIRYIYTCFKAENFLRKASSLPTLKKLLLSGCKLFHIESLHAKVMLTDDYMSIGSQNLTNKGSSNKEATFCTTDSKSIQYGQASIAQWLEEAEVITLEMIEQMESLIAPFIKEFEEIRKSMLEIDEEFEVEFKKRNFRTYQEWRDIILENLSRFEVSSNSIVGSVKEIANGDIFKRTYTHSLVPSPRYADLTLWSMNNSSIMLEKKLRYLMFDSETSKISWARLNKSRITFFCSSIKFDEVICLGGVAYNLEFDANWGDTRNEYNLRIILKHKATALELVYKCFFDLQSLNDIRFDENKSSEYSFMLSDEQSWIMSNMKEFENVLDEKLLSPFIYEKKLVGGDANEFFESSKSNWKLIRLASKNGHYFLVSEAY